MLADAAELRDATLTLDTLRLILASVPPALGFRLAEARIERVNTLLAGQPTDARSVRALAGATERSTADEGPAAQSLAFAMGELNRARAETQDVHRRCSHLATAFLYAVTSVGTAFRAEDAYERLAHASRLQGRMVGVRRSLASSEPSEPELLEWGAIIAELRRMPATGLSERQILIDAAQRRDFGLAHGALVCIMREGPVGRAICIAEERIKKGLPRLLATHPNDAWASRALAVGATAPPPEYDGPGENEFANAIVRLNAARRDKFEPRRSFPHLAAALSSTVASAGWAVYGGKHPKAWKALSRRLVRHAPSGRRLLDFQRQYWIDSDAHDAEKREWDSIIAALGAPSS